METETSYLHIHWGLCTGTWPFSWKTNRAVSWDGPKVNKLSDWPLPHSNAHCRSYLAAAPAPAPTIGLSGAIQYSGVKDCIWRAKHGVRKQVSRNWSTFSLAGEFQGPNSFFLYTLHVKIISSKPQAHPAPPGSTFTNAQNQRPPAPKFKGLKQNEILLSIYYALSTVLRPSLQQQTK